MKPELIDCPKCKHKYYYEKKSKCLWCGYDKGFEEAEKAMQDLKDAVYDELIKIGKWVRSIFMEEM